MSTLGHGVLTRNPPKAQTKVVALYGTDKQAGELKKYLDVLAALVPAEVLALHAVIMHLATRTDNGATTILPSVQGWLYWFFWGLVTLSAFLYVAGRLASFKDPQWGTFEALDIVRILIPPAAFITCTMLGKVTLFDSIWPQFDSILRAAIAVVAAVGLGALATLLRRKAN